MTWWDDEIYRWRKRCKSAEHKNRNLQDELEAKDKLLAEASDLLSRVPRYDNQSAQVVDKIEKILKDDK